MRRTRWSIAALFLVSLAARPAFSALSYSSYLGGSFDDRAYAVAVDTSGNVYLTGSAVSTDFPGTAGHLQSSNGGGASDVFVTKISSAGALLWSTYIGGSGIDIGLGIAVDAAGKVYLTGSTTGAGLPGHTSLGTGGGTEAFAAAVSADGNALLYAVDFGGPQEESGHGIAVDAAGNAYVTGFTGSMAINSFPLAGAAQTTGGGAEDAFVVKFSAAGALSYSTYLGGTGFDHGNGIVVDSGGNAYVTGQCEAAFPVLAGSFKPTITGASDAFLTKLDPTGASFLYVSYIGGSTLDEGTAVALDGANNVYITGWTDATDFPGPGAVYAPLRVGSAQSTKGTAEDAFVIKLDLAGGGGVLDGVYSTYLGASGADRAYGIAVDIRRNAYVTGYTAAPDFPTVNPFPGGETLVGGEAFVTQISSTGGSFPFSSYLGGSTEEAGQGIALDGGNNILVTGWTNSGDFPATNAFQPANAGSFDAFLTKIAAVVDIISPTIAIVQPPNGSFINYTSTTAVINYGDTGGSGLNLASLVVLLDGNPVAATAGASQATALLSGLTQGVHTVDASIADNAGNLTAATQVSFTVDLASPTIAIMQPPNGSFINYTSTTAVINYGDTGGSGLNLASLIVRLDGNPVAAAAGASQATANLTGLTQGIHTVNASISDNAGNLTAATQVSFTVDLATPTIAISRPPNGSFINYNSTTAIIDYSDTGGSGLDLTSLIVRLDGNPVSATAGASQATANFTGLTQGVHTINASIADIAGNLASATQVSFTVDLATPTLLISRPPNGSFLNYTSTTAIIDYSDTGGSGLDLASLVVRLDGNPVSATAGASQATANLTGLTQGIHTVNATIADNGGNLASATQVSFTVDLATPTIAISRPPNGSFLNYTSTTAIIDYSDTGGSGLNLASLVVRLDGNPVSATAGASQATANLTGLTQGIHTVNATIADSAGNLASATQVSFTVDLATPTITISRPPNGSFLNYTSTTAIIDYSDTGGSGLNLASLVVRLDGNPVSATAGASQATANLTGLTQGIHTVNATIADSAGNLASATQVSFTVDLATPTITISRPPNGSFLNYTSTTAVIDYSDTGGSGLNLTSLIVRLDGNPVTATAGASQATANFSGLTQGLHTVNASIADAAGNLAAATQVSFTVDLASPTIAIARPPNGSFLNYTSTTAIIDYADAGGSGLNLASLVVRLDGNPVTATAGPSQATAILIGLTQGIHTVNASIMDNAGNLTAATQVSFTVDLASPTIAIVQPPNGSFINYTSTTAIIDYSDTGGSGLNLSSLVVRLDGNPVAATAGASQATANFTGLTQGLHTVNATIADNAGNLTAATQVSFTVGLSSPTISIVQPPNGSFINYTSTTAIINYADAGGSGLNLASLIVRLDGNPVAATAGASQATANFTGLTQGIHTVNASIADNAGNLTAATQVSFTVDLATPTIAISRPPNGSFISYTSTTAVIDYADTGGSGLNLASLIVRLDGNPVSATAGASQATANFTGLTQGVHTVNASIADNAGNLASATQVSFTLDLASPTIAIVQPPNGSFINYTSTTAIINYADTGGSGLNLASLVVRLDGNPVAATAGASQATANFSGLTQGLHTVNASIADNGGNLASATQVSFTVGLSSPTIVIVRPPNGSFLNYTSTTAIIDYADIGGSGLDLASLLVRLDGNPVSATAGASQATANFTGLTQGVHTVNASIADNAGNLASATQISFTVDLASPTIVIVQPPNGSFINYTSTTAIINYADTGGSGLNLASLVVRLDGNPVTATAGASQATANFTGLTQGVHTVNASITDNAGNLTAALQTSFTVSLPLPQAVCTISGLSPGSGFTVGGTTVTVSGTDFYGFSGPGGVMFDGVNAASYTADAASASITAVTPRHPMSGGLAAGPTLLTVTTPAGTCSTSFMYTSAPLVSAACGEDFFYPSPATGNTANFSYCMEASGTARVRIYNVVGDIVARLEGARPAGAQLSMLNTGRMAPGVYLYILEKDYGSGNVRRSHVKKFVVRR